MFFREVIEIYARSRIFDEKPSFFTNALCEKVPYIAITIFMEK